MWQKKEREPTADELRAIRERFDRKRDQLRSLARSSRKEAVMVAIIAIVVTGLAGTFLPFGHDAFTLRIAVYAFGVVLAAIGGFGVLAASRRRDKALGDLAAQERAASDRVVEHVIDALRLTTVTDANGDGQTWALFEGEGEVIALDAEDLPPGQPRRTSTLVYDAGGALVGSRFEGEPLPWDRRELREPDFAPSAESLFWSPPEDPSYPWRFEGDLASVLGQRNDEA